MKKTLAFTAALMLLPLIPNSAMAQSRGAVGVVVAPVERTEWIETIEALGTLKAREQVVITSTVADKVAKINFDDGQAVSEGAILIELESAEERAELQSAKSALSESEKQYNRAKELRAKGATAQSVLDEQRRVYEIAKAQVGVAESQLQDLIIRAPFSGKLGIRQVSPGAYLSAGQVITNLTDNRTMRLDFAVPEVFLDSIRPGQVVKVKTAAYRKRTFDGTVTAIDNQIDPISRAFSVRATLQNPEGLLKAGMLMTVMLEKDPEQAIAIPESTLIPESTRNYVYVVEEDAETTTAQKVEVQIGRRQAGRVEVIDGLEPGQLLVSHGALKLADGRAVKVLANQADGRTMTQILDDLTKPKAQKK